MYLSKGEKQIMSYIVDLRNSLKDELRNMPILQNGSAILVINDKEEILLQLRSDRNIWGVTGGCQELGETFEEVAIR